jgi:hypothetical protein
MALSKADMVVVEVNRCGEVHVVIAQMRGGGRERWREKVEDGPRKVFDHEVRSRRPVSESEE